jgi:hypothetical protein
MTTPTDPNAPPGSALPEPNTTPPGQSTLDMAVGVIRRSKPVTGRSRQITDAGLLGVCLLFLAAMLGLPRLDQPLTVALFAFAGAIPFLVNGYWAESSDVEPGPGTVFVNAYNIAAWALESLGWIGVGVGVVAVLWHYNPAAVKVILAAAGFVFVASIVGGFVGLIIYAVWKFKRERPAGSVDSTDPAARHGRPFVVTREQTTPREP